MPFYKKSIDWREGGGRREFVRTPITNTFDDDVIKTNGHVRKDKNEFLQKWLGVISSNFT